MSNTPENEVRTSSVLDPENLLTAQLQALEKRRSSTRYIIVIAIALLAIVVLTCFVMSVVVIRGDTMSPNIYDGDNRPQALDSRFVSVGAVKSSDIVGKLIFLFRSY